MTLAAPIRSLFSSAIASPARSTPFRPLFLASSSFASSSRQTLSHSPRACAETRTTTTTTLLADEVSQPPSTPAQSSTGRDMPPHSSSAPKPPALQPFLLGRAAASHSPPATTSSAPSSTSKADRRKAAAGPRYFPEQAMRPVNTTTASSYLSRSSLPQNPITHTLTVRSSRNNASLTFSDAVGTVFPTIYGGTDKAFKGANRNSYEAAHQATLKMFALVRGYVAELGGAGRVRIRVVFKGVQGNGREAASQALGGPEGEDIRRLVGRVEDRTPIAIGGPRRPRRRRV